MSTEIEAEVQKETEQEQEQYYIASHWQLMRRRFMKHKLAVLGGVTLIVLYTLAIFAGFVSPYDKVISRTKLALLAPTRVRIVHDGRMVRPLPVRLRSDDIRDGPDRSARRVLREFYSCFGYEEDVIPYWDGDRSRFELP